MYTAQEEIEELDQLIDNNRLLIQKYPEKFSLKMGLKTLEARRKIINGCYNDYMA